MEQDIIITEITYNYWACKANAKRKIVFKNYLTFKKNKKHLHACRHKQTRK